MPVTSPMPQSSTEYFTTIRISELSSTALSVVPQSIRSPLRYYRENVRKSIDVIAHLLRNGCHQMIYGSSASLYRPGETLVVDEESPVAPRSPYASAKSMTERIMADTAAVTPFRTLFLRYFNPIGADPTMRTGMLHDGRSNVLAAMIRADSDGVPFVVAGTDYPTRDGTAIRDYVHVWDLAQAHVTAVERISRLLSDDRRTLVINLGSGTGTTVRELADAYRVAAGRRFSVVEGPRRAGDVPSCYTRFDRAAALLDWRPTLSVAAGIRDSLEWSVRSGWVDRS